MSNLFDNEVSNRHPLAVSLLDCAVRKGRLAHAYLLTGRAVADKWSLARQMALFLNCKNVHDWTKDTACHQPKLAAVSAGANVPVASASAGAVRPGARQLCLNCRWVGEGKHPQAWLVLGAQGSKSGKVPVEKARQLCDELAKCSQYFRTVIIEDASQDKFHRPAANALLKTIENPGAGCIFLLFAVREEEVLPTVVSRCQVIPLQNTGFEASSFWLSLRKTDGKPVAAELEPLRQSFERIFAAKDSRETIRALEFSKDMQTVLAETEDSCQPIDFAVNLEITRLSKKAMEDKQAAGYLSDLLWLAEEAKLQIEQYVSSKAAIETFVLSWWQLRKTTKC